MNSFLWLIVVWWCIHLFWRPTHNQNPDTASGWKCSSRWTDLIKWPQITPPQSVPSVASLQPVTTPLPNFLSAPPTSTPWAPRLTVPNNTSPPPLPFWSSPHYTSRIGQVHRPRVLKGPSAFRVLHHLFNISQVPLLWKMPCLVLVPKMLVAPMITGLWPWCNPCRSLPFT